MDHEGPRRFPRPRAEESAHRKQALRSSDRFLLNTLAIMGMHRVERVAEQAKTPRAALVEVALTSTQWQHILLLLSQDGSARSREVLEALSGWVGEHEAPSPPAR